MAATAPVPPAQTVPLSPAENKLFRATIDRLRSVQGARPRTEVNSLDSAKNVAAILENTYRLMLFCFALSSVKLLGHLLDLGAHPRGRHRSDMPSGP